MSISQRIVKRVFDILLSGVGLTLTSWLIVLAVILASLDTGAFGVFSQQRVGRDGRLFNIFKIRTMRRGTGPDTSVTTVNDTRITRIGMFLRRLKIDELPQLVNVFFGQMSFVGPRPDVPGFADKLTGDERIILSVRPGITGPATLYFRDEEILLSECNDPEAYNRDVIFPMKVELNSQYVRKYRFVDDLRLIWGTVTGRTFCDLYGNDVRSES